LIVPALVLAMLIVGCSDDSSSDDGYNYATDTTDSVDEEPDLIDTDQDDSDGDDGAESSETKVADTTDTTDQTDAHRDSASETSDDTTADASDGSTEENLSGVWAEKVHLAAVSDVPMVGEVSSQTISYARVEIDHNGQTLSLTGDICDLKIENESGLVQTVIPDAFVDSLPTDERTVTIDGSNFTQGKNYDVQGAELENPETDPLPTEPDSPKVIDQDEDGNPGLTIRIEGTVSGEVYVVQRGWQTRDGEIKSSDSVEGLVDWGQEQEVLGASSSLLENRPDNSKADDPQKSYFEMTRVGSQTSCSDILGRKGELFSRSP
jgi:hypothetical protein